MTNESIKALTGQTCTFITAGISSQTGRICSVEDNWVTIEDKKSVRQLINIDYVNTILPRNI